MFGAAGKEINASGTDRGPVARVSSFPEMNISASSYFLLLGAQWCDVWIGTLIHMQDCAVDFLYIYIRPEEKEEQHNRTNCHTTFQPMRILSL